MRRFISWAAAALILASCGEGRTLASDFPDPPPLPTTIACHDAAEMTKRAAADHKQAEQIDDRSHLYMQNRGSFMASLAVIAQLKCHAIDTAEADKLTQQAWQKVAKPSKAKMEVYTPLRGCGARQMNWLTSLSPSCSTNLHSKSNGDTVLLDGVLLVDPQSQ